MMTTTRTKDGKLSLFAMRLWKLYFYIRWNPLPFKMRQIALEWNERQLFRWNRVYGKFSDLLLPGMAEILKDDDEP